MIASFKLLANLAQTTRNKHIHFLCCEKTASRQKMCSLFLKTVKLCRRNIGELSPVTYSKYVFYGTLKKSIVSDLAQEIDTEMLKEKCRRSLLLTGKEIRPADLLRDDLKAKFDEAVESFGEQEKRLMKVIQLEHNFLFSEGYAIPSPDEMSNELWLQAMTIGTLEERLNYYATIEDMKNQQSTSSDTSQKEVVLKERLSDNPNSILYDCENPDNEDRWGDYRLAHAMQFGIPLVVDMDFVDMNSATELIPLTQQLWDMYCMNRAHPAPFHLIFTNCAESNPIYRHLVLHHMIKASFVLATFTEKSHTELFPKEDMLYFSAQATDCVGVFNPDTVYIIGAYFDPMVRKKGSFARARRDKLKCLRFPISENVRWRHQASKDLDMNHVVALLLSVKSRISWKDALNLNVPMLINHTPR